jgi:demethylmenaquinone methyltransferase/2-methoxy-6-polyprenyl-1,4-benzoquinol methylase
MNCYKEGCNVDNVKRNCKQKDFFNQRACKWDRITKHDTDKIEYILSKLKLRGNEKILDVGTGTGILIPFFIKHLASGKIIAIDFSEKMIEVASNKFPPETYPQVEFVISDVYNLKYSSQFDIVMCYSCFPHFNNKPKAISILKKTLKHQGKLVVAHSNSRDEINNTHMKSGDEISADVLPSISDLKNMIKDAGLEVIFQRDNNDFFMMIAEKK